MELECLIDFRGTAQWRRGKFEQYPEDARNAQAAGLLDQLADQAEQMEGSDLHRSLEAIWLKGDDQEVGPFQDRVGEVLRSVGFGYEPRGLQSFVADLIGALS